MAQVENIVTPLHVGYFIALVFSVNVTVIIACADLKLNNRSSALIVTYALHLCSQDLSSLEH